MAAETRIMGPWGPARYEENKRVARIIRLAALLTTQPRYWTRPALAAEFEVGVRQISRDLELLHHAGYALTFVPRQGYAFKTTPRLPSLSLSAPEALALALAAGLARDSGDLDAATLGAVLGKLEALVPPGMLPMLRRDLSRGGPDSAPAQRGETLRALKQAQAQRRRVRIVYETGSRGGARSERVIEPYDFEHYERFWIVIAYDHQRGAVRDFKLDRIRSITPLEQSYTIPESYTRAAYRGGAWGLLRGEAGAPEEVALRCTARVARWIQEEERGIAMTTEAAPEGSVIIRFTVGVTDELARWLLQWGPECRVLAPATLRQQVRAMAQATVSMYTAD